MRPRLSEADAVAVAKAADANGRAWKLLDAAFAKQAKKLAAEAKAEGADQDGILPEYEKAGAA
jgi:hypothetical protein